MRARLTRSTATATALELRAAGPLWQFRHAARVAQGMADPDVSLVVRALAHFAAREVGLSPESFAAPADIARPDWWLAEWWAAVVLAEEHNAGEASLGTLMALADQPSSVVAQVMVRLLHPAGLVRGIRL